MDRLVDRGINPWSVPGVTPGVFGGLIVVLAVALALRATRRKADPPLVDDAQPASWRSAWLALLLCLAFAGLSLGRGLPFAVDSAIFIFSFTAVFSWKA